MEWLYLRKQLWFRLAFIIAFFGFTGCGDASPWSIFKHPSQTSRRDLCASSCESRGGEFYLMQGEYCYCSFTQTDGGTDK